MNTAMILCAGFGKRMESFTKDTPKPMLPIMNKPILEHTIRHLAELGFTNIVINLHYLPEQITEYFRDGKDFGVNIHYSYENEPLGTAGAVKKVESILKNEKGFLVLYGDVVCNENYYNLLQFHRSKKNAIATIVLHERKSSNSVVEMDSDNKIIRFIERPKDPVTDKKQDWVNSGLYCFRSDILNYIPQGVYCDFPKDVFPKLVEQGNIYGYPLTAYRCAIDSPERYAEAEAKAKADFPNFLKRR
ncbi:MAG: nucleotidyltransferase family protein [Pseudomonadota bacterium]